MTTRKIVRNAGRGRDGALRPEFKSYIKAQIQLPRNEWDAAFGNYVEKKRREAVEMLSDDSPEVFNDNACKKRYNIYLKYLCVTGGDRYFSGKDVIDLGCGEGEFILECLKRGKVKSAYGLDLEIRKELSDGKYGKNFIKGDYTKKLPFSRADIIVSNGGASTLFFERDGKRKFEKLIRNCIRILSANGEIRIAPINCCYSSKIRLVGIDKSIKKLANVLKKLSGEKLIDHSFEPIDIQVSGWEFRDVFLWQALIIKKRS
ncbi:MAG: class I SAM-dependent methyltransferase [Candidatus Paceibacterota bacterium]|jgi:SAM-dependent methyltransferase